MWHERTVLCDMHCNMMQRDGNPFTETGETNTKVLGLIKSQNEGLGVPRSCAPFAHGSRAARMDYYDESKRSLSSSTALPLSLLGWYGADLSLRRSR